MCKICFFLSTGLTFFVLVILGLSSYPGSTLIYVLFSAMFWLMLGTALGKRTHYGYLFLVVALWLGFWLKITAHLLLKYPYAEPIGSFDGSATAWDNVLWVGIVASAGVMVGKLLWIYTIKRYSRVVGIDQKKIPAWYPVVRKWIWSLSLMVIFGLAALNLILGIQQIGLVPRTILPWPLNALIAWQVSIGSALFLTVLLWWEMSLEKSISVSIYALLIEAIISTVSLLSRGVYIFHTIPNFFALFENRKLLIGVSKRKVVVFLVVFLALLVVSISGVSTLRDYMYPHAGGVTTEDQRRLTRLEVLEGGILSVKKMITQGEQQEEHLHELLSEKAHLEKTLSEKSNIPRATTLTINKKNKGKSPTSSVLSSEDILDNKSVLLTKMYSQIGWGVLSRILSLAVDRWIGLEGVMAVTAYPDKGRALLMAASKEKRDNGKVTKFQYICNSHYRWVDAKKWQFASLPGAAAFFYFSGSLLVVMFGMMIFSFLLQLIEQLIFILTGNPLLCSFLGMTMANSIAQFGIAPRQDIPFYSMIFGFVLVVSIVQSDRVCQMVLKFVSPRYDRGVV